MLYLDTSLLVAALTHEADTARAQAWLSTQQAGDLAISYWVLTEFSSALSIKLRTSALTPAHRATALAALTRLVNESFEIVPASSANFRAAARFADQFELGLRAGDALHLAIAHAFGATVVTLDLRLAKAADGLGVSALLL